MSKMIEKNIEGKTNNVKNAANKKSVIQTFWPILYKEISKVCSDQELKEEASIQLLTCREVTVSACFITFNEELTIKKSLKSIVSEVDEVIVVDSFSTDQTIEIIRKMDDPKIKVFQREWDDSFANARNFAVNQAIMDWIIFLDGDEYILNAKELRKLLTVIDQLSFSNKLLLCPLIEEHDSHIENNTVKIFKNDKNKYYFGLCHEEIFFNNKEKPCYVSCEINYHHSGYTLNSIKNKDKIKRNLKLIEKMIKIEPNNPKWVYFVSREGKTELSVCEIEDYIFPYIKIDSRIKSIKKENINKSSLSYDLCLNLLEVYLYRGEWLKMEELYKTLTLWETSKKDHVFLYTVEKIRKIQIEIYDMLQEILLLRQNNAKDMQSKFNNKGYHFDLLIAVLFYENGFFEEFEAYLNILKEQKYTSPIMEAYKEKLNRLKKIRY